MRRVVVTGMGAVTPLANNLQESWTSILNNESGIRLYLNDEILKNDKPFHLSLVKNFDFAKWKVPHAQSRLTSFLTKAVSDAISNSQLKIDSLDLTRSGICIGNMSSSISKLLSQIEQSNKDSYKSINRLSMLQVLANIPAATLGVLHKFQGPSLTVSTACASGLSAIVQGYKWIKLNQADLVIVGAAEDVYNPLYLNSSLRLQAMTSKEYEIPAHSSRPFDRKRSGFVLGEGSGALVIQQLEHAKQRGANIIAEIMGYGYTSDGFHLVRPEATGKGQISAMRKAIQSAGLSPKDIDHVNVHATSTEAGDQIQARSLLKVFQTVEKSPSISAIKGYFGHTFGAAGAIQTTIGLMSMINSIAPKIPNLSDPDVIGPNYCIEHKQQKINYLLKNSFGFGGINISAVFRKY